MENDLRYFEYPRKATHQETLGFYIFHCFNISKHISISVPFFIISFSCVVFFTGFLKIITLGVGDLAQFFCPRGRGFPLFLPGNGAFALSKIPGEGWSGLELIDTLSSRHISL